MLDLDSPGGMVAGLFECMAALRAARERVIEQRTAGGRAGTPREHVALAVFQPLAVFELPQFVGDPDQHVGIGPDAEPAARGEELTRREDAVAEACFGDGAEAGNSATASGSVAAHASKGTANLRRVLLSPRTAGSRVA